MGRLHYENCCRRTSKNPVATKRRGLGVSGYQIASTALSAAGGRGLHYSALIFPHESNWRVVGFSLKAPMLSQDITFDLFFNRISYDWKKSIRKSLSSASLSSRSTTSPATSRWR